MTKKKFRGTEDQFRKALLKWLSDKHQQLRANVHGDDDTSQWCKDEADLVEQHIETVESLLFVNEALKTSADEAHRQADLAYDRIEELEERLKAATDDAKEAEAYAEELEAKLAKAVEGFNKIRKHCANRGRGVPTIDTRIIERCKRTAANAIAELKGEK